MPNHDAAPPETETFVDRGRALPERYPGGRLRAMVRDPETIFVYWEHAAAAEVRGWRVQALDQGGDRRIGFDAPADGRSGYLHGAVAPLRRVQLLATYGEGRAELVCTVELPGPAEAPAGAPWVSAEDLARPGAARRWAPSEAPPVEPAEVGAWEPWGGYHRGMDAAGEEGS